MQAGLRELQAKAEAFVAANWLYLSSDTRITNELEAASLCRVHQLVGSMHPVLPQTHIGMYLGTFQSRDFLPVPSQCVCNTI